MAVITPETIESTFQSLITQSEQKIREFRERAEATLRSRPARQHTIGPRIDVQIANRALIHIREREQMAFQTRIIGEINTVLAGFKLPEPLPEAPRLSTLPIERTPSGDFLTPSTFMPKAKSFCPIFGSDGV